MTPKAFEAVLSAAVLLAMLAVPVVAPCPAPAPVANTVNNLPWLTNLGSPCANVAVGTECIANCKPGYTSVPVPRTTCTDGTWTVPAITCKQVCSNPPAVVTGITWGTPTDTNCANSIPSQGLCQGTCDIGTGAPTAKCSTINDGSGNSVWTYTGGCVLAGGCPTAPPLTPPNAKPITNCLSGENGAECPFTCNTNYAPDIAAGVKATCTDGAWVNSGKCVQACTTAPPPLAHGTWGACANSPAGFVCQGTCDIDYSGTPIIKCGTGGAWLTLNGGCAPVGGCPTLPHGITNAGPPPSTCAGLADGLHCHYTCNPGAAPLTTYGPSTGPGLAVVRFCNQGVWSEPSANCTQVCRILAIDGVTPLVPELPYGEWLNECRDTPVGGKCEGACMGGRYGAPYIKCGGGGFEALEGGCSTTPVCAGVPAVTAGVINGGWPAECANTLVGGACPIHCNTGYAGTASVACVVNPANTKTGADWTTTFTGTMCTRTTGLRHKLV